jgi:hypothetical protein
VLSACATVNKNLNVDVVGDMPTTCPSEYMVAVTNVSPGDTKVATAGYGPTSIDLGAPGNDTYTTASPSGYGTLGGTSAATPHVSGSIGLLYSMGCTHLTSDALTNPAQCARRVRDVLLGNVAPNPTLQSVTTTGGRLDLSLAVAAVRDLCEGTVGPLSIKAIQGASDRNRVQVLFETPDFEPYNFRVFNMLGQLMHEETVTPSNFSAKELEFDAAYWPAGIYVAVLTRGKAVASLKFRKI